MSEFIDALFLTAGYNAALVAIGAGLLGFAAGSTGTFLFLRKRALVSDAVAHATLPGVALSFIVMVLLGGDGRSLIGLLVGSAITAWAGLLLIEAMVRKTRLAEDTAIGAVLGVFFGFGVVLLTVIQSMSAGRQAGLEEFLLGATAGMLFQDAVLIAIGGGLTVLASWVLRRPMTMVAFDTSYASSLGYNVKQVDLAMMGLAMAVTVIGLKLVGLVLIVALLIIPAVTARFWTERSERLFWVAGILGGVAGYVGAGLSAAIPSLPTGPIIVLLSAVLFSVSLLLAPNRGALAAWVRHKRMQAAVHRRQGLLALATHHPIREKYTLRLLGSEGLVRPDGVATDAGRALAAKIARDEHRWTVARRIHQDAGLTGQYDGLTPIDAVFTPDEIAEFDRQIGAPKPVE